MTTADFSIVQFFKDMSVKRCGYCNSPDTSHCNGMWAYTMKVMDYQNLIDRGWRRCGQYCYKPVNELTCCPMYTIQCRVADFKISKSQKKVLKRMNNFLRTGKSVNEFVEEQSKVIKHSMGHQGEGDVNVPFDGVERLNAQFDPKNVSMDSLPSSSGDFKAKTTKSKLEKDEMQSQSGIDTPAACVKVDKKVSPSTCVKEVQSPGCTPRKKAKAIRLENKYQKLKNKGFSETEAKELLQSKKKSMEKELEDYIQDISLGIGRNRMEVRLVRTKPPSQEYLRTSREAYLLYKKYQVAVHNDDAEDVTKRSFERFLVNSPLEAEFSSDGSSFGYGSFHQQYWLDGVLIAVGVIDILPYCLSSVYFYYDPDLRVLTLGTYGSLREIAFTKQLNKMCPNLKYYYMGYYIHSCPKMIYKGQYSPSYLLCPETYTWHPIEKCLPKLDRKKYSRLEEDETVIDENETVDIKKMIILQEDTALSYPMYRALNPYVRDEEDIVIYSKLVGAKCALKMLLVNHF